MPVLDNWTHLRQSPTLRQGKAEYGGNGDLFVPPVLTGSRFMGIRD